ncbi:MAG: hypothetical protein ABFR89_13465, partial [Actinomycetota bacterium]
MNRTLHGIVVGTAIGAAGFWLALFALGSSVPAGLFVIAVSLLLAMLAIAGFGGEEEPLMLGVRAAITGLAGGSVIFILFAFTGSGTVTLLLPAVMLGIGGVVAYPADRDPQRLTMRIIVSGAAALVVVLGGLINI